MEYHIPGHSVHIYPSQITGPSMARALIELDLASKRNSYKIKLFTLVIAIVLDARPDIATGQLSSRPCSRYLS
jgi:hypothetical protein